MKVWISVACVVASACCAANPAWSAPPLPEDIAKALQEIEQGKVEYPDRAHDMKSIDDLVANGEFKTVRFKTGQVIEKQKNLKAAAAEMPPDIKTSLDEIEKGKIEYPERAHDMSSIKEFLANGEFDLVRYRARQVLDKQSNLKSAANGMPADLKTMLEAVEKGKVAYPDRPHDMSSIQEFLANGEFDMARFKARKVIEKQDNLRQAP